jgi:serine/threonine-protein kinase
MMPTDPSVDDAARAILDGTPPDWTDLESSDDLGTRSLTEQLKVLSTLAGVHRSGDTASIAAPSFGASQIAQSARLRQWGHLQLLERVGAGAFGEVYRAWDARLDREVALKLLPPLRTPVDASSSPIIEEGRLLARVRHPNVATIYGAELIDNRVGLWMEFVRGRTLEELLRAGHQFSVSEVAAIGVELCHAVAAVHAAGLLHRDIKAQNVMRADDGRIVLMDFGTGRELTDDTARAAGSPLYLAPEVFRGEPSTVRSDVYGVGVLLYHLLTGAYPTRAASIAELHAAHGRHERTDLERVRPDLPHGMLVAVRRAIDTEPASRYGTCTELAADLQRLARYPGRRRWLTAVLAAAAATAVLLTGWVAWSKSNTSGAASAVTSNQPVIAVRPFRNLNTDPDSDSLVDGLTYELIRNLAIIDGLAVRSAASSFTLKGKDIALADIGQQLGANLVLEGSVYRSGDQVRVQAQLVRVAGDAPLWTEKFDRKVTDVLGIQDEIARKVVNELRLTPG